MLFGKRIEEFLEQGHADVESVFCLAEIGGARVLVKPGWDFGVAWKRVHDDRVGFHGSHENRRECVAASKERRVRVEGS